ncbi:MAG: hypothetical protein ACI9DJ_002834 [Algoriphagus sp.]
MVLLTLTNTLFLGEINKDNIKSDQPNGDDEESYSESAQHMNYQSLKNSEDGTIFYDKDNYIVAIKVNGEWIKLKVESLPKRFSYDF